MVAGVPFAPAVLLGLVVAAFVGFLNGFITLRFAIPSFITTLGMLFVARSVTVVISGGFPPVLPFDIPSWIFTHYVGLIRLSMFWFAAIAIAARWSPVAHQLRQLDQVDRRTDRRGRGAWAFRPARSR